MAHKRYDVEHKGEMRCQNCWDVKKLTEFPRHKATKGGRRKMCKKCWSGYMGQHQIIKQAKINPGRYRTCCKCDTVFNKCHKTCIKCGSVEMERY